MSVYLSRTKEITADGFFFARRNSPWLALGSSYITSWISGFFVLELIVPGQDNRLVIIGYGLMSALMMVILGGAVGPLFLKMGISTLPEYFEKRFSRSSRFYLSALYVFCNVAIKLLVVLVLGGLLIGRVSHIDAFSLLLFTMVVAGIYVVIGGLKTQMYTSVLEGILIVVVLAILCFWISGQKNSLPSPISGAALGQQIHSGESLKAIEGWLFVVLPAVAFWFWGADQSILQRVLSARSVSSLRRATTFHGILQVVPVVLLLVAGASFVPSFFYGKTITGLFSGTALPNMLRFGLLLALVSALMALFADIFSSTSSLVTYDFYRSLRPSSSNRTLLLVGRMASIVLILCGILLIPVSQTLDFGFCLLLVRMFLYFAVLVSAVFAVSLMSKKISSLSVQSTLYIVSFVILLRVAAEFVMYSEGMQTGFISEMQAIGPIEFIGSIFLLSIVLMFVIQAFETTLRPAASFHRDHNTLSDNEKRT